MKDVKLPVRFVLAVDDMEVEYKREENSFLVRSLDNKIWINITPEQLAIVVRAYHLWRDAHYNSYGPISSVDF